MGFSRRPILHSTRIPTNPVQISGFRTCSSCHSYSHPLSSSHGAEFKNLGRSEMRFGQLGFDYFLVSTVSNGGSGGYRGSGGYGQLGFFFFFFLIRGVSQRVEGGNGENFYLSFLSIVNP